MDANSLQSLITTVGFPIVCCGALFWYMIRESKSHKEETDKLSEALNNNTLVMTKLIERLGEADVAK